jgi:hypothetical protein
MILLHCKFTTATTLTIIRALFLFFFFVNYANGQEITTAKKMNGKVISELNDLEGIYILNLKTEKSTLTERGGYFSIYASVGDTLLFSAIQFKGMKVILRENDFVQKLFFVKLELLARILDEVKINEYKNINEFSLGIVSSKMKIATPAERKLYTANSGGGILPIDPILNWMSGRTSMLKKELEVEKKETLLYKISVWYEYNYFIQTLKIPHDYVKGFQYYIVQDAKFLEALKSKNKTLATFVMNELAVNYLQLLKEK